MSREYTLDTVRLDSAGDYHCQARNDLGEGTVGSAYLDVFQAPEIVTGLQTSIVKRSGEENFQVGCEFHANMPICKLVLNFSQEYTQFRPVSVEVGIF